MNKQRLEAFTDAILAIIMTLLVIEIKIPEVHNSSELLTKLLELTPIFLSFFLSFMMIVNYWTTHHFMITVMAKNVNRKLMYINFLFLSFACLTPFSSHLLGVYHENPVAVIFYSANVLIIAMLLSYMRWYIYNNSQIENQTFSPTETLYGHTRVFINLTSPLIAILAAPFETKISLFFLLASVIINLIPGFIALILRTTKLDQKLTPLIKQPHFAPNSEVSISDKG